MTTSLKLAEKLFEAIQTNDFNLVSSLLSSGANPNRLLLNGVTPFHLAVGADSTSCYKYVSEILNHTGNPNVYDTEGHTPLHVAAIWGKADCLRLMLQHGGDINLTDKEGRNAEWFAKDNHNCMVILNDYKTEQSLDASAHDKFTYNLRKINLSQIIHGQTVLGSPVCSDCGKRKSLSRNRNNNILPILHQTSPCKENHEICVHNRKKDTALVADSLTPEKVVRLEKHTNGVIKNRSQDEVIIPLKGFNPNNISFRTGIDVTSPDNCYMFIRKHSSPNETLDKTVLLKANTNVDSSVDVQSLCETPRRPVQSIDSLSSSSGSCSDFTITEEQRRQMMFDTRANHADAVHSSGDISPSYVPQEVSYSNHSSLSSSGSCSDFTITEEQRRQMMFDTRANHTDAVHSSGDISPSYVPQEVSYSNHSSLSSSGSCSDFKITEEQRRQMMFDTRANHADAVHSSGDISPSYVPQEVSYSNHSSLSSSGSCSDFKITEEQRRQMMFDTRANHADGDHSSGDISPSYIPQAVSYTNDSSLSSSGSCSDFEITEEQRRQMMFDTRANHVDAGESSDDISPSYIHQAVSYTNVTADDSVFSLADTTVALNETEKLAETLAVSESCHDKPNSYEGDGNVDTGQQATNNFKETRERLQSTRNEDMSQILPKSFDISLISNEDQIFLYSDSEGNSLIEHRRRPSASSYSVEEILSPPIKLSVSQDSPQNSTVLSDSTVIYDWKSLLHNQSAQEIVGRKYQPDEDGDDSIVIPDNICQLSDKQLRSKLVGHGLNPGPISAARVLYMKKLCLLERGFHVDKGAAKDNGVFSHEMRSLLAGKPLPPSVADDDRSVRLQFDNPPPSGQWRGGNAKDSFNYLLLDPRVTDMLPNRAKSISESECLRVFAGAVFYVGKGKKARPYAHFKEALSKRGVASSSPKLQHIHDIWRAGCGVVSLHIFQNAMACEAFTREAAIIEALGIGNLTNGVRGKRYGIAADWTAPRVRRYGAFLVLAAMQMLLLEGERQIRPHHISKIFKQQSTSLLCPFDQAEVIVL